jgi:hypothetical protein
VTFDIGQLHPTFVFRNDRLLADCAQRGWTIGASRVTADYAQQKALYDAYRAGHGNLAANPDAPGVMSPWGWQVHGSFHQVQADGYSHAIDYTIVGCTWDEFHPRHRLSAVRPGARRALARSVVRRAGDLHRPQRPGER